MALFLDVDGTLLEFCDDPAQVSADPDLVSVLESLWASLDGALSLISGRPVADVDRIFAPARFPVAGAHGAEIRSHPDDKTTIAGSSLPEDALTMIEAFTRTDNRLLLEKKKGGVSLHYRRAPELASRCRRLIDELMPQVESEYRLIAGKMVLELAPRGHDKGAAIRALMAQQPFTGRKPVFFGDDVTDEDGFRAVNELHGVSVRVGNDDSSAARFTIDSVRAVRHWLNTVAGQIGQGIGPGGNNG